MSEPNDTVTDFSPICPHCGVFATFDDGGIAHVAMVKFSRIHWQCTTCQAMFTIEVALVYTTKKIDNS